MFVFGYEKLSIESNKIMKLSKDIHKMISVQYPEDFKNKLNCLSQFKIVIKFFNEIFLKACIFMINNTFIEEKRGWGKF